MSSFAYPIQTIRMLLSRFLIIALASSVVNAQQNKGIHIRQGGACVRALIAKRDHADRMREMAIYDFKGAMSSRDLSNRKPPAALWERGADQDLPAGTLIHSLFENGIDELLELFRVYPGLKGIFDFEPSADGAIYLTVHDHRQRARRANPAEALLLQRSTLDTEPHEEAHFVLGLGGLLSGQELPLDIFSGEPDHVDIAPYLEALHKKVSQLQASGQEVAEVILRHTHPAFEFLYVLPREPNQVERQANFIISPLSPADFEFIRNFSTDNPQYLWTIAATTPSYITYEVTMRAGFVVEPRPRSRRPSVFGNPVDR